MTALIFKDKKGYRYKLRCPLCGHIVQENEPYPACAGCGGFAFAERLLVKKKLREQGK